MFDAKVGDLTNQCKVGVLRESGCIAEPSDRIFQIVLLLVEFGDSAGGVEILRILNILLGELSKQEVDHVISAINPRLLLESDRLILVFDQIAIRGVLAFPSSPLHGSGRGGVFAAFYCGEIVGVNFQNLSIDIAGLRRALIFHVKPG